MTPIKKRSRQHARVPAAVATLARRILLLLRDIVSRGQMDQPVPAHLFGCCRTDLACAHAALPSAIAGRPDTSAASQRHEPGLGLAVSAHLVLPRGPAVPFCSRGALCPAVWAFFRLRFVPFLLSRHFKELFTDLQLDRSTTWCIRLWIDLPISSGKRRVQKK
jgi:hypothetical protein